MNNYLAVEYKHTYNQYKKVSNLLQKDFNFYIQVYDEILENFQNGQKNSSPISHELQNKIFSEEVCNEQKLEAKKNAFLKILFETEQIRQESQQLDLLEDIIFLCQKANKIIQKHWEFYQYKKNQITTDNIISLFFTHTEQVLFLWDSFVARLEIFSKIFISSEKQNSKPLGKDFLQTFFCKEEKNTVDIVSMKNFIELIYKVGELFNKLQLEQKFHLGISEVQLQKEKVIIEILLPEKLLKNFSQVITQLHSEKMQKDGLQQIITNTFYPDTIRSIEKKEILNFQKQFKNIITKIKKVGNFEVVKKGHQEISNKILALLEKIKESKKEDAIGNKKERKAIRNFLFSNNQIDYKEKIPITNSSNTKIEHINTKEKNQQTDHINYLSS